MVEDKKPAEEKPPYDEELVALIREKGTAGLNEWRERNSWTRINLQESDLRSVDLREADLSHANLHGANLHNANLHSACLVEADLRRAILSHAELTESELGRSKLQECDLSFATMDSADLHEAEFDKTVFRGARLQRVNLEGAMLSNTTFEKADLSRCNLSGAYFQSSNLTGANLEWANLHFAKLDGAIACDSNLRRANLHEASAEGADFSNAAFELAILKNAKLKNSVLKNAELSNADMTGSWCLGTNLEGAVLVNTNLSGARIFKASLISADACFAIVDGETLINDCIYDHRTRFNAVGLGSCRIDPGMRADLEYNVRRQNWEKSYHENWTNWLRSWLWWPFWMLSDYGRSTGRLLASFVFFAVVFAVIYLIPTPTLFPEWCPTWDVEPFVTSLETIERDPPEEDLHLTGRLLITRSLYFSVVTMTTLGFGDIHANPESEFGHWLLMAQVMLGYVLLGGMITRLAIMFQGMSHK